MAILTVSDRSARGERPDLGGPTLAAAITARGWTVTQRAVVPDEQAVIRDTLSAWSDGGESDVILTTGGTGFAPRDVTPEATLDVIQREAPGLVEEMRAAGRQHSHHAMLSRARAGIRKRTLIVNLPGNPSAAAENLEVIALALEHGAQLLREDPDAERGHTRGVV